MDYNNLTEEDCRELEVLEHRNKVVRHFKGDFYMVLDFAEHTETGEKMVVYRALYGDCKLYTRPLKMFAEKCNEEQFKQYGQKYRFQGVELASERED